jgi:hypothetical protein
VAESVLSGENMLDIRVFRKLHLAFGAEFRAICHNSSFEPVFVFDRKESKFGASGLVFTQAFEAFPRAWSTECTARLTERPRREPVHVFPSLLYVHERESAHGAADRLSSVCQGRRDHTPCW